MSVSCMSYSSLTGWLILLSMTPQRLSVARGMTMYSFISHMFTGIIIAWPMSYGLCEGGAIVLQSRNAQSFVSAPEACYITAQSIPCHQALIQILLTCWVTQLHKVWLYKTVLPDTWLSFHHISMWTCCTLTPNYLLGVVIDRFYYA